MPQGDDPQKGGKLIESLQAALGGAPMPDEVAVRDVRGREHFLPGVLPARRQVPALRLLGRLIESGQAALAGVDFEAADLFQVLDRLLADEAVVELLGQTFHAAYPDASGEEDPLDLFPVEELVAGLLPMATRFLRRGSAVLSSFGGEDEGA